MAQGNLLGWSNSIRFNMASDSGREFFQQQVQTQGFLFLDDYLDNILSGTKQDPIIDLVKTPGRRKVVKKPKTASKLANPIFFSLGPIDENKPPVETAEARTPISFEDEQPKKSIPSPVDPIPSDKRAVLGETPAAVNTSSDKQQTVKDDDPEPESEMDDIANYLDPAPGDQPNLSVIAEDEEEPAERSHASTVAPPVKTSPVLSSNSNKRSSPDATPGPSHDDSAPEPPAKVARTESPKKDDTSPVATSKVQEPTPARASINSTSEYHSAQATPRSPKISAAELPKPKDEPKDEVVPLNDNSGSPKAPARTSVPPTMHMDSDLTGKFSDTMDMTVPLRDADATNKTITKGIPSLPEPGAMRKSIRVMRDPSVGSVLMGAATPGGKRTSWLMRAREIKALDKSVRITPAPSHPPPVAGPSGSGSKRKSGDVESLAMATNDQEPKPKVAKLSDGDNPSTKAEAKLPPKKASSPPPPPPPKDPSPEPAPVPDALTFEPQTSPGVFGLLKKTMEGLVGSSKPAPKVGSDAFSALAEAKAAAAARIAARDQQEGDPAPVPSAPSTDKRMQVDSTDPAKSSNMTTGDLFPSEGRMKDKGKAPEKPFQFFPMKKQENNNAYRTSTTPPHSPPALPSTSFVGLGAPVFTKAPVFVPPSPGSRPLPAPPTMKQYNFKLPESVFTAMSFPSPKVKSPLTAQSTAESVQPNGDDDVQPWVPTTQDTEYTEGYGNTQASQNNDMICDEDDSWPIEEKLAQGFRFTTEGAMSDATTTWSSLASRSQGGDTRGYALDKTTSSMKSREEEGGKRVPGAFNSDQPDLGREEEVEVVREKEKVEKKSEEEKRAEEKAEKKRVEEQRVEERDEELEDAIIGGGIRLVTSEKQQPSFRPQSQMSMASTSSGETQPQSQGGFLNQASKLINSALGTGKKKQPEVKKPISKTAAAAAKRQQEEADKKAKLKEMEARRQQAAQKKAEEEKARQAEEERKRKEEMDRRKREREEQAEKQRVKPTPVKKTDESQTQRMPPPEKKLELKKTTSIPNLAKSQLKPAMKPSAMAKSSTYTGSNQAGPSKAPESASKVPKFAPSSSSKGKAKAPAMTEDELGQPSQFLHDKMAARAKAQIQAAKHSEPLVPSESIELPDINSEYSDSDDEDRKRTYDPPDWAQSPELKEQLKIQSTINPDDIFGAVKPLNMEEMFKKTRFRPRTSSANWVKHGDQVTTAEEKEYAIRMGYK